MDKEQRSAFARTRKAIRDGEALYDTAVADLRSSELVSARRFRLTQFGLSVVPTLVLLRTLAVLTEPARSRDAGQALIASNAAEFIAVIVVVSIEVAMLLQVPLLAKASMLPEDRTEEAVARASRVLMYHDGAYSTLLDGAMMATTAIPLWYLLSFPELSRGAAYLLVALVAGCAMTAAWAHLRKPRARDVLFTANGYGIEGSTSDSTMIRLKREYRSATVRSAALLMAAGFILALLVDLTSVAVAEPLEALRSTLRGVRPPP